MHRGSSASLLCADALIERDIDESPMMCAISASTGTLSVLTNRSMAATSPDRTALGVAMDIECDNAEAHAWAELAIVYRNQIPRRPAKESPEEAEFERLTKIAVKHYVRGKELKEKWPTVLLSLYVSGAPDVRITAQGALPSAGRAYPFGYSAEQVRPMAPHLDQVRQPRRTIYLLAC